MFSDWLRWAWGCCRKCEERLTGGDGDAEWKEAELPKEPGMFTGAELCSKLPPARGREGERVRAGEPRSPPTPPARPRPVPVLMLPSPATCPPMASTDRDAAWVGHCAVIESLL